MSQNPIAWVDTPIDTKERQVITGAQLGVPSLRMFGHHSTAHAISALNMHYHTDCFEFTYFVHGNVRFSVGGRTYPLSGGDLFVTFPNEVHDTGSVPMSLHQMYWFQLEASHPEDFLFMAPTAARVLLERLQALPTRVVKLDVDESTSLLSRVFQYFRSDSAIVRMQGAQLLGFFLYRVVECADLTSFRITPDIGKATDYILSHIQEELSMEVLAQVSLLSVSRFKQKFKLQMGTSPRNFINFHKIETARKLLLEGRSVTDVAMELGFSSSNYFSSVFRRYTSFAPSEYLLYMSKAPRISPGSEAFLDPEEDREDASGD